MLLSGEELGAHGGCAADAYEPGADVNVIDLDGLRLRRPEMHHSLPGVRPAAVAVGPAEREPDRRHFIPMPPSKPVWMRSG